MKTASVHDAQNAAPATGSAAISVDGVRAQYDGQDVLRGISFAIPTGSVYGLVGPSGSGKTTLMRAILGLKRTSAGAISVLGERAGSPGLRKRIGYMPQNAAIYPDLTGRENLDFFGAIYGVPRGRVAETLDLVELGDIANRPVATYSGGQRQRIALAAALLPRPHLLILDEPTIGLDPRLRYRLWAQFRTWASEGTTLLVSTHVMDEASHTDQLAFIVDGQLVASGTPASLLDLTGAPDLESAVLQLTESRLPA